jgi:hypothetical protein
VATVSAPTASRWSDNAFLDRLRRQGDLEADDCFAQVSASGQSFGGLFEFLNSNSAIVPDFAPAPIRSYFAACQRVPTPDGVSADMNRLRRGEAAFMRHACCSALVLLANSLPAGYAAPNLAQVLVISGNLKNHPYRRLLGVLQMVVNVTARDGFAPDGKAVVTAAKLRLLHAGVRHIARQRLPDYDAQYGVPVNHEDMLATIMGFSLLVVRGLQELEVPLDDDEAEDYYYLWRMFALAMGIHPPGQPDNTEYLPETLAEADEFYRTYSRRHYRQATQNPEGVELTRACLLMLEHMVAHTPFRRLGVTRVPRVYMQQMLGAEGLEQRGVTPVRWHALTRWLLLTPLRLWTWLGHRADRDGARHFHERIGQMFFQGLINRTLEGEVTFLVPERLSDLHALTEKIVRPYGERRRVQRRVRTSERLLGERRSGNDRRLAFRAAFWGTSAQGDASPTRRAASAHP